MAKDSNEEYLENLLGEVSKYTSDEDFLNEVDGDFPELNDEKFMEQYAQDIDNVFEEGYQDQTFGRGRRKKEPEPEAAPSAGTTDLFGVENLVEEAATPQDDVNDVPEIPDLPEIPETPDLSELESLGDIGVPDIGDIGDLGGTDDPGVLGDLGDMGDLSGLGDLGDIGGLGDLGETGESPDPGLAGEDGGLADLADVADLDNLAPADLGVSDELASLFDETEEYSATDMSDEGQVNDLLGSMRSSN